MSKVFYVGISGQARSGKDTLAAKIWGHLSTELHVQTHHLADPIKAGIGAMFPVAIPNGLGKEEEIPKLGISLRRLYQTLGTEWGRDILGEDIWLDLLRINCEWLAAGKEMVVLVPDVRFDNEASQMNLVINISREDKEEVPKHRSEEGISDEHIDYHVVNNDDLLALDKKASALAMTITSAFMDWIDEQET